MSAPPARWEARVVVRLDDAAAADRLRRSLAPEARREVPRARSSLGRGPGPTVTIRLAARDAGALRAALNTFLGWVALVDATERVAARAPAAAGSEALI